jgi:hypothetical protein
VGSEIRKAKFEKRELPITKSPDGPMLQSQITNRKSPMARWPEEPVLSSQIDGLQSQV